jgi:hypothetical protein
MKFIKSWKFMAIIVGVIFVVALVGVIVGVTTHEEAGFDPTMTFLADGVARGGVRVPISTCVSSYNSEHGGEGGVWTPTMDDLEAVSEAADAINSRVNFELLHVGPINQIGNIQPVNCRILVNVGVPQDVERDEGGGWAYRCGDSCCVDTTNTGTSELTHLVIQHELGHCLGLAHDDFDSSIMRPTQRRTPDRQFPPRITDHDRDLLREAYRPTSR